MSTSEVSQPKSRGFTLFPTPPTSPLTVSRTRLRRKSFSFRSSQTAAPPPPASLLDDGDVQTRSASTCSIPSTARSSTLIPAPLRIHKTSYTIDSEISNSTASYQTAPNTPKRSNSRRKASEISDIRQPKIRALFPWQSTRSDEILNPQPQLRNNPGRRLRNKSSQLNYLLDVEHGQLDRKKLSMYLGNVLDASFQIPELKTGPESNPESKQGSVCDSRPESMVGLEANTETPCCMSQSPKLGAIPHQPPPPYNSIFESKSDHDDPCVCVTGTIICQCSSSPEFKLFSRVRRSHKMQSSVSSTSCMIGVPRARFKTAFLDVDIPESLEIPNMSSPPGLSYSSGSCKSTGSSDWSSIGSPSRDDDLFFTSTRAYQSQSQLFAGAPVDASRRTEGIQRPRQSRGHSFSRPFVAELPTMPEHSDLELMPRATSTRASVSSIPRPRTKRHNYLGNMELLSTFNFDFDLHRDTHNKREQQMEREQSIRDQTQQQYYGFETSLKDQQPRIPRRPYSSRHSSHTRNQSNSSTCSSLFGIIESANTAVIAKARPAKPILVLHTRTSSISGSGSTSTSTSTSSPTPKSKSNSWNKRLTEKQPLQQSYLSQLQQIQEHQKQQQQRHSSRPEIPIRNPANIATSKLHRASSASILTPTPTSSDQTKPSISPSNSTPRQFPSRAELGTGSTVRERDSRNFRTGDMGGVGSNDSPVLGRAKLVIVG